MGIFKNIGYLILAGLFCMVIVGSICHFFVKDQEMIRKYHRCSAYYGSGRFSSKLPFPKESDCQ